MPTGGGAWIFDLKCLLRGPMPPLGVAPMPQNIPCAPDSSPGTDFSQQSSNAAPLTLINSFPHPPDQASLLYISTWTYQVSIPGVAPYLEAALIDVHSTSTTLQIPRNSRKRE